MPHSKIHGYGSDFGGAGLPSGNGYVEHAWAHAEIARENITIALSDMVEMQYLDLDAAKQVARGWMYDNPNEFFRLGP